MSYVIKRTDSWGGYLAQKQYAHSYTKVLQHARLFDSREEAEGQRCPGNERVVSLEDAIRHGADA